MEGDLLAGQTIVNGLEREGESVTLLSSSDRDTVDSLFSLMNTILRHW